MKMLVKPLYLARGQRGLVASSRKLLAWGQVGFGVFLHGAGSAAEMMLVGAASPWGCRCRPRSCTQRDSEPASRFTPAPRPQTPAPCHRIQAPRGAGTETNPSKAVPPNRLVWLISRS